VTYVNVLVPRPGYGIEDLKKKATHENAEIHRFRNGILKEIIPVTNAALGLYDVELPREVMEPDILHARWRAISIEKTVPKGYLADGQNPFKQIIGRYVHSVRYASMSEICDYIILDGRHLPNTRESRLFVEYIVKDMHRNTFLLMSGDEYKVGRELPTGNSLIPLKVGYNPNMLEIWEFTEYNGKVTTDKLVKYMIEKIGWIESVGELREYLNAMLEKGYLERVDPEHYSVKRHIEPYGG